jgi:AraC-like DNA-binding protein
MPLLDGLVEEVRVAVPAAGRRVRRLERLPDGTVTVFLQVTEGGVASRARRGVLCVGGPVTRALYKTMPPFPLAIGVRFRPGAAAPLLGVPAHELTDRIVRLEDLWDADGARLREALLAAPGVDEMLERLQGALRARLDRAPESPAAGLARQALRRITESATPPRVEALAADVGVSARHLRRAFTATVGIGPKAFARAVRFQRAAQAAASQTSWAAVAAEAGYYDQAHLIGDFRALAGTTPGAFVRRVAGDRW